MTYVKKIAVLFMLPLLTIQTAVALEYNDGVAAFNEHDYTQAIMIFDQLLQQSPAPELLDNIHFWLGESRFARGEFLAALYHFERVFSVNNANKRGDALLKIALCYRQLKRNDNSCAILNSLDQLYHTPVQQTKRLRMQQRHCPPVTE
jgi:TolA-binding protein